MLDSNSQAGRSAMIGLVVVVALAGCTTTPVFRSGQVRLPIMVAADAAPEEHRAAEELARVLGVMSGLDWPVQLEGPGTERGFYVGHTQAAARLRPPLRVAADLLAPKPGESGPDSFRISTRDGSVFLEGATVEAADFAVSWLLQHQGGVRWYVPGPAGEVIPRRTSWSLPTVNVARSPAYVSRDLYNLSSVDGAAWARHNGLRGRIEFSHALSRVIPATSLSAHPDWAPLLRGRRYQPESADDFQWQPNLVLPAVAEYAAQAAETAFERDPQRASFSLAMNDTMRFDQGPDTRALVEPLHYFRGRPDYSPLVFTFMNRAAEVLARTNPDRYLGCLAYFWCENIPSFPVNPQVMPYVTTDRSHYYNRAYRAEDLALMSRWGASGVRAFGLWEYGEGGGFLVPRVPVRALAEGVREGWARGARGYFAEMGAQWGFDAFKVWALAQLLWEPGRSTAELSDDFYRGYFGAAATPMHRFFERCEEQWMGQEGPPYWLKLYQQEDQALLFPLKKCGELRALLTAAASVAADTSVAARVERTSQAFAVTEAYVAFDTTRRELTALSLAPSRNLSGDELVAADLIRALLKQSADLEKKCKRAQQGELPALAQTELAFFIRNDPVPRLLWIAGRHDPNAPARILAAAGPDAEKCPCWKVLAEAMARNDLENAPNVAINGFFRELARERQEPEFLFPRSGALPAGWEVRALATEMGSVALTATDTAPQARALRIEGAWDTQLFQWLPAQPGSVYIATAQLRGNTSAGNDSALFLTFLAADGKFVGTHRMQSLPKGVTPAWSTAALADVAPAGAAWVGVGVGASRQVAGDWLETARIELRNVKREPAL